MGIAPPVKPDMVRVTGHHSVKKTEEVVIKKDELHGTRKLITFIRAENGIKMEADVFGILDAKGYLRNDLVSAVNCICCFCAENYFIRKENKEFWFDLNPEPCVMLGATGAPPPGVAYDVGLLSVRENLQCPHEGCKARFRITMGRMSKIG
jgi:hypothetical protein